MENQKRMAKFLKYWEKDSQFRLRCYQGITPQNNRLCFYDHINNDWMRQLYSDIFSKDLYMEIYFFLNGLFFPINDVGSEAIAAETNWHSLGVLMGHDGKLTQMMKLHFSSDPRKDYSTWKEKAQKIGLVRDEFYPFYWGSYGGVIEPQWDNDVRRLFNFGRDLSNDEILKKMKEVCKDAI